MSERPETPTVSLQDLNTLALPAHAERLVAIHNSQDLLGYAQAYGQSPRLIIGGGSNLVLQGSQDHPLPVTVLHNRIQGIVRLGQTHERVQIRVGGGENWHRLVMWSLAQGLAGLENLALIPGTVGAAPIQNIGAYGLEVADRILRVHAWDFSANDYVVFEQPDCGFGYRHSRFKDPVLQGPWHQPRYLISAVDFELFPAARAPRLLDYAGLTQALSERVLPEQATPLHIAHTVMTLRRSKLPDPSELPNVGSFFQNPLLAAEIARPISDANPGLPVYAEPSGLVKLSAAWLIDAAGFKGVRRGDAGVYERHALVLVNHGQATAQSLLALAREVQQAVMAKFGVWLEPEPVILPPLHAE